MLAFLLWVYNIVREAFGLSAAFVISSGMPPYWGGKRGKIHLALMSELHCKLCEDVLFVIETT